MNAQRDRPGIVSALESTLLVAYRWKMGGYAVCRRLETAARRLVSPAIFLISSSTTEDAIKRFNLGGAG